jgi:methionyl-tRNA formyltransferase
VTYAHKIQKSEAELDWHQPAPVLEQKIRAFVPWPVAFNLFSGTQALRVWSASVSTQTHHTTPGTLLSLSAGGLLVAAGQGSCLNIETLQLPGKKPQPIKELLQNKLIQALFNSR